MNDRQSWQDAALSLLFIIASAALYAALAGSALAALPPTEPAAPTAVAPDVPLSQTVSRNWAGYVAQGKTFTGIAGTWTVPASSAAPGLRSEATWVGIGGVSKKDLIQAGTQTIMDGGDIEYQAWYEILPDYSQTIPLTVRAGDSVSVSLVEASPGRWLLNFIDNTTGKVYQKFIDYDSSHSSAEWVEEMPLDASTGSYIPLASFGSVSFTGAYALAGGQRLSLQDAGAEPIRMGRSSSSILAAPSAVAANGSGFSVTRNTAAPAVASAPGRGEISRGDSGIIYIIEPDGDGGFVVRLVLPPGLSPGVLGNGI